MKPNYSDKLTHSIFTVAGDAADILGVECYAVGGFVRDIVLDRPSKDIDIMSVGSGIELAKAIAKKLHIEDKLIVYKNFGTAMLPMDDYVIEFVGARKESYRTDSRKPIVEDGTLHDDLSRRDFTINALALCLNKERFGELVDEFDGMADMERKIIRTPLGPDITYSDDPLRMMRAVRFASQLNFVIEKDSLDAISRNADRLKIISMERIADELNKIIESPVPSVGFKLLFDTKLLHQFFPQMVALHGVDIIKGKGHKDNFYHTLQVLDNLAVMSPDLWLRWAAILHDIAKPPTKRFEEGVGWTFHGHEDKGARMVPKIFAQLKLPLNEKMKYVQKLVLLHLRPIVLAKSEVTDSAIRRLLFEAGDDIDDLMMLCTADITSKNPEKVKKYKANFELVKLKLKEVEEKDKVRNWQPPVTGEEIMEYFGISPSREVGIIKTAIREAILDGIITNNHDEAMALMIAEGEKLGLKKNNQ
jgi:putative nucleotidyltransferase with HDIG domain